MSKDRIIIKGTSNGLVITLGAGTWSNLIEELDRRLGEKASFFKGGRVALRVGPRQLTSRQLETAGQILNRNNVTLWAVESESAGTLEAAAQLGLETELIDRQPVSPPAAAQPHGEAIVLRRPIRSGQVIYHPGHVVVIGDVNPGAEIRAGGSVIVWGRLRGTVHAGTGPEGDEAVVCALQLTPTQLRIGGCIARSPAEEGERKFAPEMALVQDGQIIAEPWHN